MLNRFITEVRSAIQEEEEDASQGSASPRSERPERTESPRSIGTGAPPAPSAPATAPAGPPSARSVLAPPSARGEVASRASPRPPPRASPHPSPRPANRLDEVEAAYELLLEEERQATARARAKVAELQAELVEKTECTECTAMRRTLAAETKAREAAENAQELNVVALALERALHAPAHGPANVYEVVRQALAVIGRAEAKARPTVQEVLKAGEAKTAGLADAFTQFLDGEVPGGNSV